MPFLLFKIFLLLRESAVYLFHVFNILERTIGVKWVLLRFKNINCIILIIKAIFYFYSAFFLAFLKYIWQKKVAPGDQSNFYKILLGSKNDVFDRVRI